MKLTVLLTISSCLQASGKTYGQHITINKQQARLQDLFIEIYQQSGYYFFYNSALLEKAKRVDINVKEATLETVLEICFKDQPLRYVISDKIIIVQPKNVETVAADSSIQVKGKILNERGEPLPGASIRVEETGQIMITDDNGSFLLPHVPGSALLTITNVGYQPMQVRLNNRSELNLRLALAISKLDEVQVIAYGTISKRLNTGNVSKVSAEEIEKQPVANPIAALQGRVPGLYIQQESGVPGSEFFIRIRGQNSIAAGNEPLYIVDGVPYNSVSLSSPVIAGGSGVNQSALNYINPKDIESIEVMKDADATAIYGSRGANGVILISTKKAKPGKPVVDINLQSGTGRITKQMDLMNTEQYLAMRHEAFANDGTLPKPFDYDVNGKWDTTRYTDWQKLLIGGHSSITNLQATLSGGSANTLFSIGGNYFRESTVFPGDFAELKGTVHVSLVYSSPDQKFKTSFTSNFTGEKNDLPQDDPSGSIRLPPDAPKVYDSVGGLNWENSTWNNPLAIFLQKHSYKVNNLISNLQLSYQIIKGLDLKCSLGYTQTEMEEKLLIPVTYYRPSVRSFTSNTSQFGNNRINSWIVEPQISYNRIIGKGQLELLLGSTIQENRQFTLFQTGTGYISEALMENLIAASSIVVNSNTDIQYRYAAFFGRINYNLKDKYLLNLTGRRDGSSRFGPGSQFANFGAVGAGWIFSNESFLRDKKRNFSFGKLRSSYGITGNDQIGDYQFLDRYSTGGLPYQGVAPLSPSSLFNPNYSWEVNRKFEIGLDLGFFRDKLFISSSYYLNRSSNQLVGYSLSTITGFNSILENRPALVQNSGLELDISSTNIQGANFSWKSAFNISFPKNKLVAYPNLEGSSYANLYTIGKSLYSRKLYLFTGVDPASGIYTFATKNPSGIPSYPDDLITTKELSQQWYGGFLNSFQFKGFQLDIFFQFVKQNGSNYLSNFSMPGTRSNQLADVLSRWQQTGDQTNIQKFSQSFAGLPFTQYLNLQYYSDYSISDASFIRLKNISLSYHFATGTTNRLHMRACQIFLQAQNLLTITHYKGTDPENRSLLPPLKVINFGIQASF